MSRAFSIPSGETRTFSIAGLHFAFACDRSMPLGIRIPWTFERFQRSDGRRDMEIRVRAVAKLAELEGRILYDSAPQWRAVLGERLCFELVHPATSALYCRAVVESDFSRADVLLSESVWSALRPPRTETEFEIPYPLEQLLMVPMMARRGAVLLHACGAVISDRSLVFAGHSGDGKTTLARLLEQEGVPLLSDERVVIREMPSGGLVAYGTPWPGEGEIVSEASHPLRELFILRKAETHFLGKSTPSLFADLLSRAIVPYYLPDVVSEILEVLRRVAFTVPLRELHFAKAPGLTPLLSRCA